MNCHEAREGSSDLGMGLTERALVHAHVLQCVECRKERESLPQAVSSRPRVEPSRAAWLTRLRVLLSISLTLAGQVAVRVVGVLAILFTLSVRAAAHLIGRVRFVITRFAHLLIGLRSPVLIAFRGSARAAIEAAGAGVTRGLDLLPRLSVLVSIFLSGSRQALARVAWVRWRLPFQGIARAATEAVRAGVTRGLDLLARLRQTKDAAWTTRPLLRVCTAIVGLAVLVAVILFSAGERLSQDVRLPADADPTLAETSTSNAVSAPEPALVGVSRPETPRVAMRPKPPETQTEIPAPLRRPDPAFAQRRATASAPVPSTETAQNAEASDPTAAIDWLLKGGSSRRRIENP
jgi:hypothetical protein